MEIKFNISKKTPIFVNNTEKYVYSLKKCIYTANIGGYDSITFPTIKKSEGWDYIYFTNNKFLTSEFWTIIYVEKPNNLNNVQFARDIKINFYKYLPNYELTIWIDSNILINVNLEQFTLYNGIESKFIVPKHPERNCIYDEAQAIIKLKKASKQSVLNQIEKYRLEGYPEHNNLVETNLLVRFKTERNIEFCKLWFNELLKHTHRDQLSFNYTLWKYPINIKTINSPIRFSNMFALLDHSKSITSIAVIMCTWNRIERLHETIKQLESQTYQHFDFYIWNNNIDKNDEINDILSKSNLNIKIYHSEENVKGFGRFYYAKEIYKEYPTIIFIDDDLILNNDSIARFYLAWKTNTIFGWWAWEIYNNKYFNRRRVKHNENAHYIGTAAMVLDSEIFSYDKLYECPEEFKDVEDIWINFIANHYLKWDLKGLNANVELNKDDKDMSELNPEYMNDKKQRFLEYLIKLGWKL